MSRRLLALLLAVMAGAGVAGAAGLYSDATPFPEAALFSNRDLLDPPAGRHGFVTAAPDGSFRFEDGAPVRFWGVSLAHENIVAPDAPIERIADLFARVGINLVRFHQLDDPRALLVDGEVAPDRLAALDRWIAVLAERGIYSALELHTYRTFRREEGVLNAHRLPRGGKPYLLFDARLQAAWLDFARSLLTHHNPLRGRSYAQDPAVAFVELYGENGLVLKRREWRSLAMPYQAFLADEWNQWLAGRYAGTPALRGAWGQDALGTPESLERRSVELPAYEERSDPLVGRGARRRDGMRFAAHLHRRFFQWAAGELRGLGARVPLAASGDQDALPELWAMARELDAIAASFYWDHPLLRDGSWRPPFLFRNESELTDRSSQALLPFLAIPHVQDRPLIVYEWNFCYPNRFRAEGPLQMAAAGRWQGWDALLAFHYSTRPARGVSLTPFDLRVDAARWGLMAHAARLFLTDTVQPARQQVILAYPEDRCFEPPPALDPFYQWAWKAGVTTAFETDARGSGALYLRTGDGWRNAGDARGALPPRPPWRSDTGEMVRDPARGAWRLQTATAVARAGPLEGDEPLDLGPFLISCREPFGVLVALALDGVPLAHSRRVSLKFVSEVEQGGTGLERQGARWALTRYGTDAVRGTGRPHPQGFRVEWRGRGLLTVPQRGGLWETLWQGDGPPEFWSDVDGVRARWQGG